MKIFRNLQIRIINPITVIFPIELFLITKIAAKMKQVSALKIYALSIFLLGTFFQVMGQSKLVNGTVLDEKKNPISGATVTINGTKTSPNTDIKGGGYD